MCLVGGLRVPTDSGGVHGAVGSWLFQIDWRLRTQAVRQTSFFLLLMLLCMRLKGLVTHKGETAAGAVVVLVHLIAVGMQLHH